MKKIFVITLVFTVLLSSLCCVSAAEAENDSTVCTNQQYGYTYENYVDEDGRIIRSYSKESNRQNTGISLFSLNSTQTTATTQDDPAYVKSVLSDLGMGDSFIDALPTDSLNMYANAESITSISTYSKTDSDGNTILLDEDTALEEAAEINAGNINLPIDFGNGEGNGNPPDYYYDTETDSYLKITLTVSVLGDGKFHYAVDTEWLTTPSAGERYYDSIGICVSNNSLIAGTQSGWYDYLCATTTSSVDYKTTTIHDLFSSSSISQVESNGWLGIGCVYQLPIEDSKTAYSNFKAHFEFKGQVNNPSTASYFYATATYEHITSIGISKPNLEITTYGSYSYVSMKTSRSSHTINVPISLPIHHVP